MVTRTGLHRLGLEVSVLLSCRFCHMPGYRKSSVRQNLTPGANPLRSAEPEKRNQSSVNKVTREFTGAMAAGTLVGSGAERHQQQAELSIGSDVDL